MWKDKPALVAALVMICGFLAARTAALPAIVWSTGALVFLVPTVVSLYHSRRHDARTVRPAVSCVLLLFFSSAVWYAAVVEYPPDHITRFLRLEHPVRVYCRVADEPRVVNGRAAVLVTMIALVSNDDSAAVVGNALLTIVPDRRTDAAARVPAYGDLITFEGIPEEPQDTRNPGEVSYRAYLALNNIFAVIRIVGYRTVAVCGERRPNWFFEHLIFPSRHFVSRTIGATLHGDEAKYLIGLLLGDRTDISADIQKAFANTGTVHVLAVSGSHVVVIVVAIYTLFSFVRMPRRMKAVATICAIIFYMYLTGATPSVVRASLMASVVLIGKVFQQRSSVYNSLGVSAILMFLYDPKQLFDVGFQLSFAAVFSMVYFYPKLTSWTRAVPRTWKYRAGVLAIVDLFAVSAAAQIGTIPFTAFYFEKVSLISFFANLVVVPLAGFNIALGFVAALASLVWFWAGSCVNEVNGMLAQGVLLSVKAASRVPYAIVHTPSFGVQETALYVCAVTLCVNLLRPVFVRRMMLVLFCITDVLLLENACASTARVLRLTFLDVGQGDAAIVEFPGGATMVVDGGPRTESNTGGGNITTYDAGERVVVPVLRRKGIRPNVVLVTHPHDDHLGGVPTLLRELGTDRLIESPQRAAGVVYQAYAAARTACSVRSVTPGDTIAIDPAARVYILHPSGADTRNDGSDLYSALNNASVVCRITYGTVSFLLMGDAERSSEAGLVDHYGDFLRCAVIKIGHHGSNTGSTAELLTAAAPQEAVVSVGRFNRFHHPSRAVMTRLRSLGIAAHRTDREGALVYETDGISLTRVTWR